MKNIQDEQRVIKVKTRREGGGPPTAQPQPRRGLRVQGSAASRPAASRVNHNRGALKVRSAVKAGGLRPINHIRGALALAYPETRHVLPSGCAAGSGIPDGFELPRRTTASESDAALEARLAALVARGRDGAPRSGVDDLTFVRHLARCASSRKPPRRAPRSEQLARRGSVPRVRVRGGRQRGGGAVEQRCDPRLKAVAATTVKIDTILARGPPAVRDCCSSEPATRAPDRRLRRRRARSTAGWPSSRSGSSSPCCGGRRASAARARAAVEAPRALAATGGRILKAAVSREFERAMADALAAAGGARPPRAAPSARQQDQRREHRQDVRRRQSTASRWLAKRATPVARPRSTASSANASAPRPPRSRPSPASSRASSISASLRLLSPADVRRHFWPPQRGVAVRGRQAPWSSSNNVISLEFTVVARYEGPFRTRVSVRSRAAGVLGRI